MSLPAAAEKGRSSGGILWDTLSTTYPWLCTSVKKFIPYKLHEIDDIFEDQSLFEFL
jgi:hypothetical protein